MRENQHVQVQAEDVQSQNEELQRHLELVQKALNDLGIEYNEAVETAETAQM